MAMARIVLILALAGSSAAAAPDETRDAKAEATRLSDEGAEALRRHEPAAALAAFDAALRLYPSAKLQYNRGLALDSLGRSLQAATAFERFLVEVGDGPEAQRSYAARRLEELDALSGHLALAVQPPRARLTLDGQALAVQTGTTAAPLRVSPGSHTVGVELEGYQPARRAVEAPAGETVALTLTLEEKPSPAALLAVAAPTRDAPPKRPLYRRWWLWAAVGGVVAAGIISTAVVLGPSSHTRPRGTLGEVSPMF
jgi:tetratricopeptide (TPR) repeat protein